MENSVMVMKKKGNQKGFSLVELLIVIAIMGVLAVIAFNAFNGVLVNSKMKADQTQAKNIQKSIRILITDSGILDLTATNKFYKETTAGTAVTCPAGVVTGGTALSFPNTQQGVKDLIIALQNKIYIKDLPTSQMRVCGPYLDNSSGSATATYDQFAPQWSSDSGGKNTGYAILIKKSTNSVNVFPTEGIDLAAGTSGTDFVSTMNPGILVAN